MANGDAAGAQGFAVVQATDDIRLGYDGINRAADFAALRVIRNYVSKAELDKVAGLFTGAFASAAGITYLWNGTAWRAWESDWITWGSTWGNTGATANRGGFYRYSGGKVRIEQVLVLASNSSNAVITSSLPVAARTTALYGGGTGSQSGWWATGRGNLFNGSDCDLVLGFQDANNLRFGLVNSSRTIDTIGTSFTVASGNSIRYVAEYDPA